MHLFISEDEFRPIADDAAAIADRADAVIRDILRHLVTVRAEAKADSTCADKILSILGKKYSSLHDEISRLEAVQHSATIDSWLTVFADDQVDKAKMQLTEVTEVREKKTLLQTHINRIVPLQESKSKEAKLTRNLISEKEAKCQFDLVGKKKLNDALQDEAHTKIELEKHKESYFVKRKRLKAKIETLKKEKDVLHHKNQALQNHIEGMKNIGESTSEHAKKDQEKDTRIQTLVKDLKTKEEELKRQRDAHYLQQNNCKSTRKLVYDILQKVKQERTKVEQDISKHKNDSGIFVEGHAYFQSVDVFEKFANSVMNEGDGTKTVTTESALCSQRSIVVKNNDQAAPDSALCYQTGTFRKSSPASLSRASVSERRSPCPGPSTMAAETDEPAPSLAAETNKRGCGHILPEGEGAVVEPGEPGEHAVGVVDRRKVNAAVV